MPAMGDALSTCQGASAKLRHTDHPSFHREIIERSPRKNIFIHLLVGLGKIKHHETMGVFIPSHGQSEVRLQSQVAIGAFTDFWTETAKKGF